MSRFISILGIEVVTIEPEDALKALREVGCHQPGRILLRTAAKVVGYNFRRQASKSRYAGNGVRHTPRSDAWRTTSGRSVCPNICPSTRPRERGGNRAVARIARRRTRTIRTYCRQPTNGSLSSAITSVYPLHQGSPFCQATPWRNPAWFTAGGVSFCGTYSSSGTLALASN